MEIKTIVRIEHPSDGVGMFIKYLRNDSIRTICVKDICPSVQNRHSNLFPMSSEERLSCYKENKEWFHAYKTIEQLQQWVFPEELKTILSHGYVVLLLDVKEYQEGRMQTIYTKESIVSSKDISSLFV